MAQDSRKIRHEKYLTTVDRFVGGFRPVSEQQGWYERKAAERKTEAEAIAARERARKRAQGKLNE